MQVQNKEPLEIEWAPFYVSNKDDFICIFFSKIPAKTHFLCLQALLNVEVIEIQRYAKMSDENSEKNLVGFNSIFFSKQSWLLWFQDYCKRSEGCQTMASNENPKVISWSLLTTFESKTK